MTHATSHSSVALYDSDRTPAEQRTAFTDGDVPVGVYGLGKMGLPIAAVYADVTSNVSGADIDPDVVRTVNRGESPVANEPGLDEAVADAVTTGALEAFSDPKLVAENCRVHVVIVPTLLTDDGEPDLSAIEGVTEDIASGLTPGDIVFVESTLPPRTCVDELLPLLEAKSGLSRGEFGLAFCPERTKSGRALADVRGTHTKVVGGVDDESRRVAELVYEEVTNQPVRTVSDTTTAEAVKVFEGVYRDVNIALANELGRHADGLGIDVTEAIDAANSLPVCDIHTPGAGVGGHCIPYYPHFLIDRFDADSRLLETARTVNDDMPTYTADQLLAGFEAEGIDPANARVLVLGLTYRPGVDEIRATPSLPVVERLVDAGVEVVGVDPVLTDFEPFEAAGIDDIVRHPEGETAVDGVVLVTPHEPFEALDVSTFGRENQRLVVVDGRQSLVELHDDDGVHYRGIGLGNTPEESDDDQNTDAATTHHDD